MPKLVYALKARDLLKTKTKTQKTRPIFSLVSDILSSIFSLSQEHQTLDHNHRKKRDPFGTRIFISPLTFKRTQEFVSVTFHSYSALAQTDKTLQYVTGRFMPSQPLWLYQGNKTLQLAMYN